MANQNAPLPTKAEAVAARKSERDAYSPIVKRLRLWVWVISMVSWVPYFVGALLFIVGLLILMFAVFTPEFWQGTAQIGPLDFLSWAIATVAVISVFEVIAFALVAAQIALGAALVAQRKNSGGTDLSTLAFVSAGVQIVIWVMVVIAPQVQHMQN